MTAHRYLDSSVLAGRYLSDPGHKELAPPAHASPPWTSRLTLVEIASAVHRRHREALINRGERDQILKQVEADTADLRLVECSADLLARASSLLARHPLRAGDAIQLASALSLLPAGGGAVELWTTDSRLATAAAAEGLRVHPKKKGA